MGSGELREQAYNYLHQKIVNGELEPGARISEQFISKELGISRMPVRDAVRQLQNEGLVEQVPRYGTVIFKPKRKDVLDLYKLRESLETFAAAEAATNPTPSLFEKLAPHTKAIEAFRDQIRNQSVVFLLEKDLRRFLASDMAFHMLIVQATGNERLIRMAKKTQSLSQIFSLTPQNHDLEFVETVLQFHDIMCRAFENRDVELARNTMAKDIRLCMRMILECYDFQQDDDHKRLTPDLPAEVMGDLDYLPREERGGEKRA